MTANLQSASPPQNSRPKAAARAALGVFQFQWDKVTPWIALRNTIGFVLPLAAGASLGTLSSGVIAATGALNVSFSDSKEPYARRARRMLASSLLVGIGVCAGAMAGRNPVVAMGVAAGWAFAAGMLVALSTAAADLGAVSPVTPAVFAAFPMSPEKALLSGLLAFAGGLLETFLAVVFWPLRRHVAERRALGDLYLELSRVAHAMMSLQAGLSARRFARGPLRFGERGNRSHHQLLEHAEWGIATMDRFAAKPSTS